MSINVEEIRESIAFCGLVCKLCNEGVSGLCKGCRQKHDQCSIKVCCHGKNLDGCWECKEFPCEEGMFMNSKIKAFIQCAKDEGLNKLAEYLKKNNDNGIYYHNKDDSQGDYDNLDDLDKVLCLLKKGSK